MFDIFSYVFVLGLPLLIFYGGYTERRLKRENAGKSKNIITRLLFVVLTVLLIVFDTIFMAWSMMQIGDAF